MTESLSAALPVLGAIFLADALRYLLPASLAYAGLWVVFRRWSTPRRIGPRQPGTAQMRRELALSMLTVVIFSLNGTGIFHLAQSGVFVIHHDFTESGWAWWWTSLAGLVIGHDAYFYAVHRLLHHPWWFRHVHSLHHRSVHPSPWAAYAFHPAEAFLMAAFLPLALFVMPLHDSVIFLFLVHMIVRNVLGHCGIALTARAGPGRWYAALFTTTLHHHLHHSESHGNFGLYFRHLDRWFGSELSTYQERLDAHLAGNSASDTAVAGARP